MKYDDIINTYNLTEKQKRDLLPVRSRKHDFVVIRKSWLQSLAGLDDHKLVSRVLLALLSRLSSSKYSKVYLDNIRFEIDAKKMAVERAMHTLLDKRIILNEAAEHEGKCRPKYYKFNVNYEDLDESEFDDDDDDDDD